MLTVSLCTGLGAANTLLHQPYPPQGSGYDWLQSPPAHDKRVSHPGRVWAHGPEVSGNLPGSENGVAMGGQGVECLASGLPECGSKLVRSPVIVVFRPVFLPHLGPQGQRSAWVGPISPSVMKRFVDLRRFVCLPQKSVSARRTARKGAAAPRFEFVACFLENRKSCFFLKWLDFANNSCRVQNSLCDLLQPMMWIMVLR